MYAMNAGAASTSITSYSRIYWRRNHSNLASCWRQQRLVATSSSKPNSPAANASTSINLPFAWREARLTHDVRRCFSSSSSSSDSGGASSNNSKADFSTISHGHAGSSHNGVGNYPGNHQSKISGKDQSTTAENNGGTATQNLGGSRNNGNSNNKSGSQTSPSEQNQTTFEKLKTLFQKYGYTFVATYLSIYFATLFTFFLALDSGLINPEMISDLFQSTKEIACDTATAMGPTGNDYGTSMNDAADAYADGVSSEITQEKRTAADFVSSILGKWEWTAKHADKVERNPHLANLVVAWVMVKFTEPMRLGLAVWVVPKVARALGKRKGLEALGKQGAQVGKEAVKKVE
mmetsp:Transcript_20152/g.40425  ORF Transcript_20152/g.40425 Transcript_20152/m.40425 type:complete len:348 (+) Transcript_20152:204-1247(+)